MTQAQDYGYEQGQQSAAEAPSVMEEILSRTVLPEWKQETRYTPFQGTDDNQVALSPGVVLRFFAKPTRQGKLCTYEQAVRFVMLCKARRLDPREGDAYIVGYDTKNGPEFNLITAHQAFLKRAEAHQAYEGMESGVKVLHNATEEIRDVEGDYVPPDCTLLGGWARVHRSDRKIPTYRTADLAAFDKGISVWNVNKAGMICKCDEADALRSAFPNSLAGMYMQGEVQPTDTPAVADQITAPQVNTSYKMAKSAEKPKPAGAESPSKPFATASEEAPAPNEVAGNRGKAPIGRTEPNESGPATPEVPSVPTPSAESPSAPPAAERKPKYCANCGSLIAGGGCPSCGPNAPTGRPKTIKQSGPTAAAETPSLVKTGTSAAVAASESAEEAPEPATPTVAEQAEDYAAGDIDAIRKELTVAGVGGGRKKAWAVAARDAAKIPQGGMSNASEDQIRTAAYQYKLAELTAPAK